MQYRFRITKDNDIFRAECIDFDGCFAEDSDLFELRKKIKSKMGELFQRQVLDSEIGPVFTNEDHMHHHSASA